MKKFAKLSALILSLVMVCSCLIGCSEDEIKKIVNSAGEINKLKPVFSDPEELVESCFSIFKSGDVETTKDCFSDEALFDQLFASEFDIEEFTKSLGNAEEIGLTQEQLEKEVNDIFEKLLGEVEFDVGEPVIDGNEATVDFKLVMPDYSKVSEISNDSLDGIMIEVIEEAGYTMDELGEMSEEEAMEIMPEIMPSVFDKMCEVYIDQAKDLDPLEKIGTIYLENIDDQWIIVNVK